MKIYQQNVKLDFFKKNWINWEAGAERKSGCVWDEVVVVREREGGRERVVEDGVFLIKYFFNP